jgi:DNA-repair protein XRCC2
VLPLDYAGKRHEVVWLDTDGRFSATRLQSVLINHLSVKFPKLSSCESNSICSEALQHVNIFRPQSSSQLVSTLASLPGYLLGSGGSGGSAAHFSASRSLGLIVLDSATAFYWQDRFEADLARFEALGADESAGVRSPAQSSRTLEVIAELKKLQKLFDCTILFTSTPYVKSSIRTTFTGTDIITNDGRLLPQEQPGVSPWTGFATLSLSVSHERVRQFAAHMSPEDCERDQTNRLAAVAKGHSIVSVDWSMSDTWASGVRDTMNGLDGQGSFGIRITSLGIATDK